MTSRSYSATWAFILGHFLVFVGVFSAPTVAAEERSDPIVDVEIEGLERTRESVVLGELAFDKGEPATDAELQETERRLRNLPMFRDVTIGVRDLDDRGRKLAISVEERWTLLPSANFSRTDDTTLIRIGAREVNLLGHFVEVGAAYERLTGLNSGEVWFQNPRFLGRRLDVALDAEFRNRVYPSYDDAGDLDGGFAIRRIGFSGQALQELSPWLHVGGRLQWLSDRPSLDPISDELAPSTRLLKPGLLARIGQINHLGLVMGGATLDLRLSGAHRSIGSTESFTTVDAELLGARSFPLQSNALGRFNIGRTGAQSQQHQLFVGGLDEVRSLQDMRFRGTHRWVANAEYRIPSFGNRWLMLQHVFFTDAGAIGDDGGDLLGVDVLSAGIGLRLMSPRVHGLVIRLDYAFPIHGDGSAPLSFGSRQFF